MSIVVAAAAVVVELAVVAAVELVVVAAAVGLVSVYYQISRLDRRQSETLFWDMELRILENKTVNVLSVHFTF